MSASGSRKAWYLLSGSHGAFHDVREARTEGRCSQPRVGYSVLEECLCHRVPYPGFSPASGPVAMMHAGRSLEGTTGPSGSSSNPSGWPWLRFPELSSSMMLWPAYHVAVGTA